MKTILEFPLVAPAPHPSAQVPAFGPYVPSGNGEMAFEPDRKRNARDRAENVLTMTAIVVDVTLLVAGFVLAGALFRSAFVSAWVGRNVEFSVAQDYNFILLAVLINLWCLGGRNLYSYASLLSPAKIRGKFLGVLVACLVALIAVNQMARTDPPIPSLFFVLAMAFAFLGICLWRMALDGIIRRSGLFTLLRRRLVVIGGGAQTMQVQKALGEHSDFQFVGWIQANKPNHVKELDESRLGSLHELEKILRRESVDIAVLTESEILQREGVLAVAQACENEHVQFKMVPHFFEILISGLSPETIGEMQLLGADCLPLYGFRSRFVKRAIDLIGALVGLALSVPIILIFGALVYWESPGPILYRQLRQGRNGRLFYIIKIRSMHMAAEAGGKARWAQPNDPRRLRIGAFMRRWNLDEVPQFWNVLVGQMSLVGPRPERPELIARFKSKIPHYQARHKCLPGLTGWAQVNGLRGDTDLAERIRHDIWYLENWNLWLDLRIMLMTFFRNKNAY